MSGSAREHPETHDDPDLGETVDHCCGDRPAPSSDRPKEPLEMTAPSLPIAPPNSPRQGRFAFGSGARPLDGYTIKRAIGRGGFGEVYYAVSDSGKEVAIKLILRNLDVERRGVVQCMNLKCPNLLTIYDLKESEGGDSFVVMEYVAGPSLAHVLKQHPTGLPLDEIRRWLKGLVDGVAYLHDHGIVHRDLKPANLFMEDGVVKIGDYGLAKLMAAGAGGGAHSESIGTCHYMAPEIGSGRYNTPIDVYAVGVILYEMLTGRVPFEGETVNEVLMKHLTSRPDLSALPEPYRKIVARALAKDPNHRPRNIAELLPPGDAPRPPEVRIIAGAEKSDPKPKPEPKPAPRREPPPVGDVLKIEAEEPIFYIGPDTVPPRRRPTLQDRIQRTRRMLNQPFDFRSGRAGSRPLHGGAAPEPRSIPEPPPLPSGRLRFAELTRSMLLAAPLTAILTIPAVSLLDVDPARDPQQAAFLFGMSLWCIWVVLATNKWTETLTRENVVKLWLPLDAALIAAIGAFWLGLALNIAATHQMLKRAYTGGQAPSVFILMLAAFAIQFTFTRCWSGSTARDRPRRFRIRPVVYTVLIAFLIHPLWPFRRPDEVAAGAILAVVVQLVSPWSKEAADYTRFVRPRLKRRGKMRAA